MKNIILLAPPAAGKGTLSQILSEKYGYISLSTGDILREKAKTDESLKEALKTGKLLDDQTVFEALTYYLNKIDKPYILDGFPRTVEQAKMYEELLKEINKDLGVVIYLNVDKEELLQRVTTRIICPKCKKSYSTRNKELFPKVENICDECSVELIQREDDKEEVFEKRYNEYLTKTSPLIDYYKEKELLVEINAKTVEEMATEAEKVIK